jgi:hypothetical protein
MGIYRLNENLSVRLKALQLYIYWGALKGHPNKLSFSSFLHGYESNFGAVALYFI